MGWFLTYCSTSSNIMSIRLYLGIAALGMSLNSIADQPPIKTYSNGLHNNLTSAESAGSDFASSYSDSYSTYAFTGITNLTSYNFKMNFHVTINSNGQSYNSDQYGSITTTCPAGETVVSLDVNQQITACSGSDQPECPAPKVINTLTNACQNKCLGGDMGVMYFPMPTGTTAQNLNLKGNSHMCNDGCEVVMSQTSSTPFQLQTRANGSSAVAAPAEETGSFCQNGQYTEGAPLTMPETQDKTPLTTTAADCVKKGKSFGTINGVTACYSKPTTTSTQPVTNTTDNTTKSDGTTEEKSQVSSMGSDGNVTTTTTTKSTASDGTQSTKTEEKKQDQNTFCKDNPTSPMCKEQKDPCIENDDRAGCKLVGDVPSSDAVGTKETPVLSFTEIALPSNNSCPATTTLTLGGQPIPISYDWICTYASMFKPLVIAFAFFGAALIIIGQARKE
jgi:hypothetical protein